MNWRRFSLRLCLVCFVCFVCFNTLSFAQAPYSGGDTTRVIARASLGDRSAFAFPATNLSLTRRDQFFVGNSFFRNAWVTAPASTAARDGLGPLFNANACQSCHVRDGRGRPPQGQEEMATMLIRVSQASQGDTRLAAHQGVFADPMYGDQIQNRAVAGINAEANPKITWQEVVGKFADGKRYRLRRPVYILQKLAYGEPQAPLLMSGRVAPALIGVGLLDTLADKAILANADPSDADQDGISGRANQVWDVVAERLTIGRFGWKAGQPNVKQQVAAAFNGDIGITSSLFPNPPCTTAQTRCWQAPTGGAPEVSDEILELVNFYTKTLAVPARRSHEDNFVQAGEALFREAGCQRCHVETWMTGDDPAFPELSKQQIHPYTDLLLHDMGNGLADQRPEFAADGREWRTPPLWGIGLVNRVNQHTNFLHDGRARSLEEAVLWHGGEAQASQQFYVGLGREDRRRLIAFLRSL